MHTHIHTISTFHSSNLPRRLTHLTYLSVLALHSFDRSPLVEVMSRLPLDLMTRIIEFVQVPLPVPGGPWADWKQLRQRDLAILMRVSRVSTASALVPVMALIIR